MKPAPQEYPSLCQILKEGFDAWMKRPAPERDYLYQAALGQIISLNSSLAELVEPLKVRVICPDKKT